MVEFAKGRIGRMMTDHDGSRLGQIHRPQHDDAAPSQAQSHAGPLPFAGQCRVLDKQRQQPFADPFQTVPKSHRQFKESLFLLRRDLGVAGFAAALRSSMACCRTDPWSGVSLVSNPEPGRLTAKNPD